MFLDKYAPWFLRDRNKDDIMDFDKGGMSFATFEEKLNALSRHATQLLTTEEDMIHLLLILPAR